MNKIFYGFLFFFALVSLVGGINWLVTAINSWNDGGEQTPDLIQHQIGLPVDVANVIYIVVFVCTLVLFLMVAFPNELKRAFSSVGGGMRRGM